MQSLLPSAVLQQLPLAAQNTLLGQSFFPNLISSPFMDGMHMAFTIAAVVCVIAAAASTIRGKVRRPQEEIVGAGSDVMGLEEGLPGTVKLPQWPSQQPFPQTLQNNWQPTPAPAFSVPAAPASALQAVSTGAGEPGKAVPGSARLCHQPIAHGRP